MEYALYRLILGLMGPEEQIPIRRHRLSGLDICDVTMDELDNIERLGSNVGLDFNVSLFCLVVFISFMICLSTTTIESRKIWDSFVVFTVVGASLFIVFGIKWFLGRGEFSRLIQKIRNRQVGPVGDERKEIDPADLAQLKSVEPNGPST